MNPEAFPSLLAAAQADAPWAFERIYRELAPAVTGYLRLHGAPEPDDVASEVFISVFKSITRFSGDADQFRSWVFTIAHHRLVDDRRRQSRRPATVPLDVESQSPVGGDAEGEAMRGLGVERARQLLEGLAPEQRDVLLLRLVADLTVPQIAASLGKSEGSVKALQRRGLAALRRQLEQEGVSL